MNRKCRAILLLSFCIALASGCSSTQKQPAPITIEALPGDIASGDASISLSDVSFCEAYADRGYTGYCVVTIDRSNLSDDDVYWLLNRGPGDMQAELQVNAYISSEKNSLDDERMYQLQAIYNSENIYFMFYTKDVQRERLNDFEISLQMIMSPEKDLTAATTQYYYYRQNAEDGVDYSDYDSVLSEDEISILVDALNAKIDSLS